MQEQYRCKRLCTWCQSPQPLLFLSCHKGHKSGLTTDVHAQIVVCPGGVVIIEVLDVTAESPELSWYVFVTDLTPSACWLLAGVPWHGLGCQPAHVVHGGAGDVQQGRPWSAPLVEWVQSIPTEGGGDAGISWEDKVGF